MKIVTLLEKFYYRTDPDRYLNYLRKKGCRIGEGTHIFCSPRCVFLDSTRPELLEIGNDVQITRDVRIITHGYDWAVLKGKYGDILGSAGKVKIGNNVFIGMNATILKGTVVGNNCIIGASSLVNGCFPDDVVIAGNPAKVICTIEEYYHKRIAAQLHEARELVKAHFACYHKIPEKEVLNEFFWLWEERKQIDNEVFFQKMHLVRNYDQSMERFLSTKPVFPSYEAFIQDCLENQD